MGRWLRRATEVGAVLLALRPSASVRRWLTQEGMSRGWRARAHTEMGDRSVHADALASEGGTRGGQCLAQGARGSPSENQMGTRVLHA